MCVRCTGPSPLDEVWSRAPCNDWRWSRSSQGTPPGISRALRMGCTRLKLFPLWLRTGVENSPGRELGRGARVRRPGGRCPPEQKPSRRWNSRPQKSYRRGGRCRTLFRAVSGDVCPGWGKAPLFVLRRSVTVPARWQARAVARLHEGNAPRNVDLYLPPIYTALPSYNTEVEFLLPTTRL